MVRFNNKHGDYLHLWLLHSLDAFEYTPGKLLCVLSLAVSAWHSRTTSTKSDLSWDTTSLGFPFPTLLAAPCQSSVYATTQWNTAKDFTHLKHNAVVGGKSSSSTRGHTIIITSAAKEGCLKHHCCQTHKCSFALPLIQSNGRVSPTAVSLSPSSFPVKYPSCSLLPI